MAAHLYWALLIRPRPGASIAAVAELQLRGTIGGADLCTGGAAIGAHSGSTTAAQAFDDDAATIWSIDNASAGTRLGYAFATAVSVAQVYLQLPGAGASRPGVDYGPGLVVVQYSDDGVTWFNGSGAIDLSSLGNAESHAWAASDAAPVAVVSQNTGVLGAGAAASGAAAFRLDGQAPMRWDAVDSGPGRVAGVVSFEGTPVTYGQRRVRLIDVRSSRLVRQTWSDPVTGAYAFEGLAGSPRLFMAIADDYTGVYDPVSKDRRAPA